MGPRLSGLASFRSRIREPAVGGGFATYFTKGREDRSMSSVFRARLEHQLLSTPAATLPWCRQSSELGKITHSIP